MPPKRKAAAAKATNAKKAKVESSEASKIKDAMEALKKADEGRQKSYKVDSNCPLSGGKVVDDFDCTLNQTNIGNNNNKFYVIQVLEQASKFYSWNRWGRVGEVGANALKGPFDKDAAIADFKKKFKDKTINNWDNRASFAAVPGKYTLIEMDGDAGEEEEEAVKEKLAKLDGVQVKAKVADSELDKSTQSLIKLIFNNDMFKEAMSGFNLDVKKMPLGKISKSQIAKGFECLEEIQKALEDKKSAKNLADLTSQFYTLIPHNFGRQRPPIISTLEVVREKMDMLLVLADIELAEALKNEDTKKKTSKAGTVPNPLDANYAKLMCKLDHLDKSSNDFKIIDSYTKNTGRNLKILEAWKVNRDGENSRALLHDKIKERKLLWHGTNIAVIAAILKSGLRIMPHSGGRVGKGLYFASENSKSACYVRRAGKIGIMFLAEVALGKEHTTLTGGGHLTKAPAGFDSIVARGMTEPDPKKDVTITLDNRKVTVPQGKPVNRSEFASSNFFQSEYLVYKESQQQLRYLLKMQF